MVYDANSFHWGAGGFNSNWQNTNLTVNTSSAANPNSSNHDSSFDYLHSPNVHYGYLGPDSIKVIESDISGMYPISRSMSGMSSTSSNAAQIDNIQPLASPVQQHAPRLAYESSTKENSRKAPKIKNQCYLSHDCNSSFTTNRRLKVHLLGHRPQDGYPACPVRGCYERTGTTYTNDYYVQIHLRDKHHMTQNDPEYRDLKASVDFQMAQALAANNAMRDLR